MQKKNVIVTGASIGIGAAVARRFVKAGDRVILVARRKEQLLELQEELGRDHAFVYPLDVTSQEAVQQTVHQIEKEVGPIDVLVNNAGGAFGLDKAYEADLADWEKCVNVNIKGLLYCTHSVLPGMVKQNRGHIINIGSTAGSYPYPGGNVYGGVKAFVHQFSLNLKADLLGTLVRVSCIEPGIVGETEFSTNRFHGDEAKAKAVYEKTEPLLPEDVAEVLYFCTSLPAHVNINTLEMMPVYQASAPLAVHRF